MTAACPPADPTSLAAPAARPSRRRREEIEALAAEFVAAGPEMAPAPGLPGSVLAAAGAVLATALAVAAWWWWPSAAPEPAQPATVAAVPDDAWARQLEAERERRRQELQRSQQYLQKMSASDSALMAEMSARADALVAREDTPEPAPTPVAAKTPAPAAVPAPAPVATDDLPTPRPEAPAATARPSAPPPVASAAAARVEPAAPPKPAADQAQTDASPVAEGANCRIHVSELSSNGTLTFDKLVRMQGVRVDAQTGHAFTPPVRTAGRTVVFDVAPNGCVSVARSLGR